MSTLFPTPTEDDLADLLKEARTLEGNPANSYGLEKTQKDGLISAWENYGRAEALADARALVREGY